MRWIILIFWVASVGAKEGWEFSFYMGGSWSKRETITITKAGGEKITLSDARLPSRSLKNPKYYTWRVGFWQQGRAFELELIHHKIYITEGLPHRVGYFDITDGYNFLLLNRAMPIWEKWPLNLRLGAGVVIAHPHVELDGVESLKRSLSPMDILFLRDKSGYQVAGPGVQVALEKEFRFYHNWIFAIEGKITTGWAKVDLEEGASVVVPNTAVHLIAGLKWLL